MSRYRIAAGTSYAEPYTTWRDKAECRGELTDLFYPVSQGAAAHQQIEEAKALCGRCVVREACLAWALEHNERGVWGGTSEEEREAMTGRDRRRSARAAT